MSKRQKSSTVRVILSDEAKEQEQLALRTCQEARKKWINSTHLEELEEVISICDTVTIMRNGEVIDTSSTSNFTAKSLATKMLGQKLDDLKTNYELSLIHI